MPETLMHNLMLNWFFVVLLAFTGLYCMLSDLRTRAHKGFPNPSKYAYRLTIDELLFKPAKPDQLAAKAAELLAVQPR